MNLGDQRTFQKGNGNAVVLAAALWAERGGKQLQIHMTGTKDFHTTVTNDAKSERYRRTLFRNLRRVLIENNCRTFGDEGIETEIDHDG
jgi:predicted oxidoreductase